jgi:hypothetical protein
MMKSILIAGAGAAGLLALSAAPSSAATLNVSTQVVAYCNVNLGNITSANVSAAETSWQRVATLHIACNGKNGATMAVDVNNGDLLAAAGQGINYHMKIDGGNSGFLLAETDTSPSNKHFTTNTVAYSQALATDVTSDFSLNLNNHGEDHDNVYQGVNAPSGNYQEVFTFSITAA